MSVMYLAHRVAAATGASKTRGAASPKAGDLAGAIAKYVPADVIALYVPIASGIETSGWSEDWRFKVAVGVAIFAGLYVWGSGTLEARQKTPEKSIWSVAWQALKDALFYIVAAVVGAFAWVTAVPASWALMDLAEKDWWVSGAIVAAVSLGLGIAAMFFAPIPERKTV